MAIINRNLFSVLFQAFPGAKTILRSSISWVITEGLKHVADPGQTAFQDIFRKTGLDS